MTLVKSHIEEIESLLKDRACLKQELYRKTVNVFNQFRKTGQELTEKLATRFKNIDSSVKLSQNKKGDFEFHIKFSGDLLVFSLHSNIMTLPSFHPLMKSPYIREDPKRGYFGTIMVYNFMADTIKYNRANDEGYLLTRILINNENSFCLQGVKPFNFLYPKMAENKMSQAIISEIIETAMVTSLKSDLHAPPFHTIKNITLLEKGANNMIGGGEKVGFKMSYDRNQDPN